MDESVNASSTSAPTSLPFQDSDTSEDEDNNMDAASPKFKFYNPFSQTIKCPCGTGMAKEYARWVKDQKKAKATTRKSLTVEGKVMDKKAATQQSRPATWRAQNTHLHLKKPSKNDMFPSPEWS
jgi:hypothetical protein